MAGDGMLKWIIFDVMGVIFTVGDDTNDLLVPFIQESNPHISRETINAAYLRASLGQISSRQFWNEVGLHEYPQIEKAYLDSRLTLDPGFKSMAKRLQKHFHLGLLSNDVSEWSVYLRKRHRLDFFPTVVISGDVGCRKPDPRIYQYFLNRAGAKAQECVFVDDRCKNLIAAKKLGMKTIRFVRDEIEEPDFNPDGRIFSFSELAPAILSCCRQTNSKKF
jgi:putative hydrolase of the HAD superfamily